MDGGKLYDHLRTLAHDATKYSRDNPFEANILPDTKARWHVILTLPSHEQIAASHLVDRRFGIYLPEFDRTSIVHGHARRLHLAMFPGYLFAFVWDIAAHWRRIEACTGVRGVLANNGKPITVPDSAIDLIQAKEFSLMVNGPGRRSRWQRSASYRKSSRRYVIGDGIAGEAVAKISTKSYLSNIEDLDGEARLDLLHKALGLGSQIAPGSSVKMGPVSSHGQRPESAATHP